MKAIYFLKWLFDVSRWQSFTKRYVSYTLAGVVVGLFTEMYLGAFFVAVAIWADLLTTIFMDQYAKFTKEQNQLLNDINGNSK